MLRIMIIGAAIGIVVVCIILDFLVDNLFEKIFNVFRKLWAKKTNDSLKDQGSQRLSDLYKDKNQK